MSTATMLDETGVVAACPACGRKNRVPFERLGERGVCGACKADLPPPSMPLDVGSASHFDRLVGASSLPVVVDFWAPWCGPCRMVAPELEKVAAANAGTFVIAKVNTEAVPEVAARFAVRSIPTLAIFSGGRLVGSSAGARPAPAIEEFVRQSLGR